MKHTHRWLAVHIALQWCVGLCQHTVVTLYLSLVGLVWVTIRRQVNHSSMQQLQLAT